MKKRYRNIVLSVLTVLCLIFACACAETAQPQATAQTEVSQEESLNETSPAAESTAEAGEQTASENTVEDPNFAGSSDPLSTLRLILAAVGAFAIAFMYSRSQRSKYRARNKKK